MLTACIWIAAAGLAAAAGWMDWRSRRIPNWLTVPAIFAGIGLNGLAYGWTGVREGFLGAALALALLIPFVLVRSLGAGDWKLAGAVGAFFGPQRLIAILFGTIIVAGIMAVGLIIWKKRVRQSLQNMWRLLRSFLTLHLPEQDLSLDNPAALKIPFGVAMAMFVIIYTAGQFLAVSR
jgi:prepilin peptidase CpaA